MATGTLTGTTIASTYKSILKVKGGANTVLHATTHQLVEDGDGNDSVLSLAIDSVGITGSGKKLYFSDKDGEYISGDGTDLTITSGNDIVLAVGAAGSAYCAGIAGSNNTIFGLNAGDGLVSGADGNVAFGEDALSGTMTDAADNNTAVGYQAGTAITTGHSNVTVGKGAGVTLSEGNMNTVVGLGALGVATTSADQNTAIGRAAMSGAIGTEDVNNCVAVGDGAMSGSLNAGASGSVGVGKSCLAGLTDGVGNIAIGLESMAQHTTGSRNIAIGTYAMDGTGGDVDDAPASSDNIFVGYDAGGGDWEDDEDSNYNVGIGNYVMDAAMDGAVGNVALGHNAATAVTTGSGNCCLGTYAGETIISGSFNTYIGYNADASANNVTNEIVINAGAGELVGGGANTIRIGSSAEYMQGDLTSNTWAHGSDKRIKKDIKDSELGLDFIKDLRPVTFKKKAPSEYPEEFDQHDAGKTERRNPDKIRYGFIAQEVKKAMDKAGHSEFPVWSEQDDGMQSLGEAEFITPLIKAVQELSAKVEELEAKIN